MYRFARHVAWRGCFTDFVAVSTPPPTVVQRPYDVIVFFHATVDDIAIVKEILILFGKASSLQVNFTKSSATVLHGDQAAMETIVHLGCPVVTLPITYLGISLSTRRPSATHLQPMVELVVACFSTWKAWLMTKTGRLALVKCVLSAISVH
ncbi:Serine/threonine-protein kinase SMG1 [Hordeum vulgare]|nr:Serine/threonine-protein kinase SMG1 [Hordeum vulgare]